METSKEVPVISIEEFKKDLKNRLNTFEAVKRFKSINRAIKRGHLKFEWNSATQTKDLLRKVRNKKWIAY